MKWFGKAWNPHLCEPDNEVETPVDEECPKCNGHIKEDDQGVVMFHVESIDVENETCEMVAQAWHLDCFLNSIMRNWANEQIVSKVHLSQMIYNTRSRNDISQKKSWKADIIRKYGVRQRTFQG